jgi:hypothetical protein
MTRPTQKEAERRWVEEARQHLGRHWLIQGASEPPDIIALDGLRRVGIEVREVFTGPQRRGGSTIKKRESRNVSAMRDLIHAYYLRRHDPIQVSFVGFEDLRSDFERVLGMLVRRKPRQPWTHTKLHLGPLKSLLVMDLPAECGAYGRWSSVSDMCGWVSTITAKTVQQVITQKAADLSRYRDSVDHRVLLIVSNRLMNSGRFEYDPDIRVDLMGFDEVIFLVHAVAAHCVLPISASAQPARATDA